jgi:hypothetical protein
MKQQWVIEDPSGVDVDEIPDSSLPYLFEIDTPGITINRSTLTSKRYMQKAKFRDWIEVQIGGKWYVLSGYKEWYSVMHVAFCDSVGIWMEDLTGKVTEIKEGAGNMSGFAGGWPGGWQAGYY